MVCDMAISQTGVIKQYRFYPAVMFSKARLTYNQVAAALYDNDPAALEVIGGLLPHLQNLDKLFRVLLKARAKRGAIDFETQETRMIFDDNGKIAQIVPESRNDAHRLIEECMLAANVCASEFLQAQEHPALYRVHEGPTPEKLAKLRDFLGEFGLQLGGGEEPKAGDYAKLLTSIKERPDLQLLQTVMLRSLRQAVYSPDNMGHFGLAYEAYTHFTSPIRRYPDLLVHRAIKAALLGERYVPAQDNGDWDAIGMHCSMTERRADEADRDVENWLKCYYMQDRIGEEFEGSVSAVVPFGLFVALDDVFVEGLVHISDLGSDYFHFDDAQHALVGERSGERYRLSDRVRIQLVRVNMEASKIDFRLVKGPERATARTGKTARDRDRGQEVSAPPAGAQAEVAPTSKPGRRVVKGAAPVEAAVESAPRSASRARKVAVEAAPASAPKAAKPKKTQAKTGKSKPAKAKPAKARTTKKAKSSV